MDNRVNGHVELLNDDALGTKLPSCWLPGRDVGGSDIADPFAICTAHHDLQDMSTVAKRTQTGNDSEPLQPSCTSSWFVRP